ncbi:hypothetical protein Tco_0179801 [Tanacetum coccineum]
MTTLADKAILSGADNRPPMLEKDMYDSWKSRMELYMMNRQHRRMILESVENGPLIWPSIEENGDYQLRVYVDCDVQTGEICTQTNESISFMHILEDKHGITANEVCLMHDAITDPLALVATHQSPQYGSPYQSQQYLTHQSSTPLSITYPSNDYQSSIHYNIYSSSLSIPQLEYPPSVDQQSKFSQ